MVYTTVVFEAWNGDLYVGSNTVYTTNTDDGWQHACFNWTDKAGAPAAVDHVMMVLPDCSGRKCGGKWFEIDDVWVRPK